MKRIFLLAAVLFAAVAQVAAQNSFAYQAVIRNNGEVISNKDVALRITLLENNNSYYQETQKVKTNEYGNISINVGEGTVVSGSFSSVPWESLNVMMKLEVDANGGEDFVGLGSVQIKPAPYALYAAKSPTAIQPAKSSTEPIFAVKNSKGEIMFAVFEDGVKVYVSLDSLDGNGSKAAKSSFAVAGRSASKGEVNLLTVDDNGTIVYVDEDGSKAAKSRFAVAGRSAKAGESDILAVNTEGSTFYIDEDDSKAAKSRFAVAGRSAKGDAENMLTIDDNGTIVYVDEDGSKAAKSRFAVAGRSAKAGEGDLLAVNASGSTFYVDEDGSKAAKSRFAVAGRSSKGVAENMLTIDNNGSTFYVDEDDSKAAKSRFAVAGRSAKSGKDEMFTVGGAGTTIYVDDPTSSKAAKSRFAVAGRSAKADAVDVLTIDANSSTFYFDNSDEGKAAKSRFAVAGRSAKSADDMFTVDNAGTVIFIDDPTSSKAAKSRFAVAGRSAKGGDNYLIISNDSTRFYINDASETSTGFAVVGKSSSNALLSMNKDSVNFNTSMYVTGEVQTASGKVTKMADNTRPKNVLYNGTIVLVGETTDEVLENVVGQINIDYTYYSSEKGEVIVLNGNETEKTFVLKDNVISLVGANNNLTPINTKQYRAGLLYLPEGSLKGLGFESYSMEDGIVEFFKREGENENRVMTCYNTIMEYYCNKENTELKKTLNEALGTVLDAFTNIIDDGGNYQLLRFDAVSSINIYESYTNEGAHLFGDDFVSQDLSSEMKEVIS